MRQLTARQKKLIDKWFIEYPTQGKELHVVDDLTTDEWEQLVKINDTEILWQEVNRYIWDKR